MNITKCTDSLARIFWRGVLWAGLVVQTAMASEPARLDYALQARQIAPDTWVVVGLREDFSRQNGGNIANTAFVATGEGVVVIDTGPTLHYGQALRKVIASVTPEPIREVWNTHHHPDHVFGNQAFADRPIRALNVTRQGLASEGDAFLSNVYRMTGDWAKGTEVVVPGDTLMPGEIAIGRHRFGIIAMNGHTASDLVVLDQTTGVLFAGDLVFNQRAPTTPHADLNHWLTSLDTITKLPVRVLVPGHGEPTAGPQLFQPVEQTRRWLVWLDSLLREAAEQGLDPAEIAERPLPAEFAALPLARQELIRSLAHLFRQLEADRLANPSALRPLQ